ncbi:amidohydrolase family protein [Limisalsivibrio acetivorans]|uniref:amidohydrolase family protein n=1 Tax=Limisalsivibrio acetivorans TaxID=1304888 RepID=UPI0003B7B3C9|nr:amidohydrolase family protein [Limisalsivibrio acetivorans]
MLFLKNCRYIDWQSFDITETNLILEEGPGGALMFADELPEITESDTVYDCGGRFVTKSFGCGHHHIYSTFARGMPAPKKTPTKFTEILEYVWWHLDKCLDAETIEASALGAAAVCARNGVTMVIDHHSSPNAPENSLGVIKEAFDRVGVSTLLCLELSDRDGEKAREAGLEEHERFLNSGGQGHIGLHASFTVGDDLLKRAVAMAEKFDTGVHVHVAEGLADQEECLKHHGKRVVERFRDMGVTELKKSVFSHCVHLDDNEKRIIRDSGIWVAENIESNQNNNVGLADYGSITDNVMLGTDGMHSDMIRSAKAAFISGQPAEGVGMDTAYDRFRNIHRYIESSGFEGDASNNLVILDYNSPTELRPDNFLGHFFFGLETSHVLSVVSGGRLIVKDRKLTTVDEEELFAQTSEAAKKLWERMSR